jgi:hypothetical protein
MIVAVDLDGTADRFPAELGCLMRALMKGGVKVVIISGEPSASLTSEVWDQKVRYLKGLDLGDSYDELWVVQGPEGRVAERKALLMRSLGCDLIIDNSMRNARAVAAAGMLALVPWSARTEM